MSLQESQASADNEAYGDTTRQQLLQTLKFYKDLDKFGQETWKTALGYLPEVRLSCTVTWTDCSPRVATGESILADFMVQAQRPDLVILDWLMHGRQRIALVELTCTWDTDGQEGRGT
jgi:hypothetical protein